MHKINCNSLCFLLTISQAYQKFIRFPKISDKFGTLLLRLHRSFYYGNLVLENLANAAAYLL